MLRFTIRELVLVTAIAATAIGWWCSHQRQTSAYDRLREYTERQRQALFVAKLELYLKVVDELS